MSGDGSFTDNDEPADSDPPSPETLPEMCGSTPTTPAEWEQCYVERWCATTLNCSIGTMYADVQECLEASNWSGGAQRDFDIAENIRAVNDGRASIDVDEFTLCLQELSPSRCNTAGTAAACKLRYDGTVADDGDCYANAECASPGATCSPVDCGAACCTGTCVPKKHLGDPACSGSGLNACEPGLVCGPHGCVAGEPGDDCTTNSDCDAGGYCDHVGLASGVCAADHGEGATCSSVLQCGGETGCVGLKRSVGTATCRRLSEPGDACDDYCLGAMYCDLPASGLGVCRALPSGEEPCNAFLWCLGVHEQCGPGGYCEGRIPDGESCSDPNLVCEVGSFCTSVWSEPSPVCRAQLADGETGCTQDYQCQSHLCGGSPASPGECLVGSASCP
jgi:hypothetical protein